MVKIPVKTLLAKELMIQNADKRARISVFEISLSVQGLERRRAMSH